MSRKKIITLAAMLVFGFMVQPVTAEIGVTWVGSGSGDDPGAPYIFGSIEEDGDPIDLIWYRYNTDSSTRSVLNEQGYVNQDGAPSILIAGAPRQTMVVWSRNSAQGYDVFLSKFENGAWTTPDQLAGNAASDELDPALVLDPVSGDVHLFYWEKGVTPRVMHRWTDSSLTNWSAAEQVSTQGEAACRPAGVFHDGAVRVAYEVHDYGFNQTPRQVVVAVRAGAVWTPEVVAISNYSGVLAPQVHSHNGRMWVDWNDSDSEASWTRWSELGEWEQLRYASFLNIMARDYHVRGAIRVLASQ
jgi:hypothetical protein